MRLLLTSLFAIISFSLLAQHTFSIVAVDTETGEVGSAGASCIDINDCAVCSVKIISGILPGRGAVNAQASVCLPNVNLQITLSQLESGDSPDEALTYVLANDGCGAGNFTNRQYGIVDFAPDGNPRATAYTGSNTLDYANHIIGDHYAIQGNILLGQEVLDSMETRYLNAEGSLAERLMAALQGANIAGADSRCLSEGTSSKSAFIRVAKSTDEPDNLYLDLEVPSTPVGFEPIDSVQTLFDAWLVTVSDREVLEKNTRFKVYPNPAGDVLFLERVEAAIQTPLTIRLLNAQGQLLLERMSSSSNEQLDLSNISSGSMLFLEIRSPQGKLLFTEKIIH